jgi:hypothetical protein
MSATATRSFLPQRQLSGVCGERSLTGGGQAMINWRARVAPWRAVCTAAILSVFAQLLIFILGKKW